jgi:hypothetical protein
VVKCGWSIVGGPLGWRWRSKIEHDFWGVMSCLVALLSWSCRCNACIIIFRVLMHCDAACCLVICMDAYMHNDPSPYQPIRSTSIPISLSTPPKKVPLRPTTITQFAHTHFASSLFHTLISIQSNVVPISPRSLAPSSRTRHRVVFARRARAARACHLEHERQAIRIALCSQRHRLQQPQCQSYQPSLSVLLAWVETLYPECMADTIDPLRV